MISTNTAIVLASCYGVFTFVLGLVLGARWMRNQYQKLMKDAGFK